MEYEVQQVVLNVGGMVRWERRQMKPL
jgi:hypothetical protein